MSRLSKFQSEIETPEGLIQFDWHIENVSFSHEFGVRIDYAPIVDVVKFYTWNTSHEAYTEVLSNSEADLRYYRQQCEEYVAHNLPDYITKEE